MRPLGKLYSPLSLVTTVVVMVEPSFFTLTRTPSIVGSSVEETLPVRICAWALVNAATLTLAASDRSFSFMGSSQMICAIYDTSGGVRTAPLTCDYCMLVQTRV